MLKQLEIFFSNEEKFTNQLALNRAICELFTGSPEVAIVFDKPGLYPRIEVRAYPHHYDGDGRLCEPPLYPGNAVIERHLPEILRLSQDYKVAKFEVRREF